MKELELREKELTFQVKIKELEAKVDRSIWGATKAGAMAPFDVSKHIKFVPDFCENEVDKYFLHFEKVAKSLKWPEDNWALLLQSSLVGKAREVYSALLMMKAVSMKLSITQFYELVPEAYRQKFHNTIKSAYHTHVEFARHKENLFDRWCMSNAIENNHEKLRQLILVEEFKNCVPSEVRTYLDEKKADTLSQAAKLADDYVLTHKNFNQRLVGSSQRSDNHVRPNNHNGKGNPRNLPQNPRNRNRTTSYPAGPECYHCRKKGHVMADCWYLKESGQNSNGTRPNMLVANVQPQAKMSQSLVKRGTHSRPTDEYIPFISRATVSTPGVVGTQTPIVVLRDNGVNQSLLLKDKLPREANTYTGSDVLQGVDLEVMSVPLHQIQLQSDLVAGRVPVGVRPSLPVKGVDFILGNDLAGDKVMPLPCMVSSPHDASDSCVDRDANIVYPSCAVTRAMAKRTQSNIGHDSEFTGSTESAILDEGSTDNVNEIESQVELANTILSHGRELEKACHKPEKANACGEPFEVVN